MKILPVLFILLFPSLASAACHVYFMPAVSTSDFVQPKYSFSTSGSFIPFGGQGIYLAAADIGSTEDAALTANADVTAVPDNLDQQIGAGALAKIQTALENRNIPAGWLTAATTYRSALRTIVNMFKFFQKFIAVTHITVPVITGAITLNSTFNSLSAANRQRLIDTATALSFDTSGLTGAATMRQILKAIADQYGSPPVVLGCVTI
jgi:hypothetical protein